MPPPILIQPSSGAVASTLYGTTELPFNTQFSLLARYDIVSGLANDTGALFINPQDPFGVGDTAERSLFITGTDPTTLLSVGLRQGPTTALGTVSSITISAVPEPTSMAMIGLVSVAGLAVRYRRTNASASIAL